MNKPRIKARLKAEALEKAYLTSLGAVFVAVFLTLDTAFGHDRHLIPFGTALLVAWGAASITNTFLSDAYDTRINRLRALIPPATTGSPASPSKEAEGTR